MLKVLLADTDGENIRNFKTFIRINFSDLRVAAALTDPTKSVYQSIRDLSVRIVIADVRFLGVMAYQTVRDVAENCPGVRFILYGTYNDVDYLKRCMEFGVSDYMFRPVKPAELTRCIQNAIDAAAREDEVSRKESALVDSYKTRLTEFEDLFFRSLFAGHIHEESEIQFALQYFGYRFEPGYTVFILRIDHFKKIILALDELEKHMMIYKILLILQEKLSPYTSRALIGSFNAITTLLCGKHSLEQTIELCESIKKEIFDQLQIRVTIGIGRTYGALRDIPVSCREADGALRYRFYLGYNTVIPIQFAEPNNAITYRYAKETEERLVHAAVIGEYAYCRALLGQVFGSLRDCGNLPDNLIPRIVMNILISISRYLSEIDLAPHIALTTFFPSKEVFGLNTPDSAQQYLENALKPFCEHIVRCHAEQNETIYTSAKAYIDERYSESFSIARVAAHVGSTPEYLNQVFVEKEGKTAYDYAIEIRMDIARRLLGDGNAEDEAIALKVGYEDVRHFRSVFRQHSGFSTQEFRQQQGRLARGK